MATAVLVHKIYQLLVLRGLSQAELARRIGMQPSHLNRFLKGHGDMGSARLIQLFEELGVDLDQVLSQAIDQCSQSQNAKPPVVLTGLEAEALENWIRKLNSEKALESHSDLSSVAKGIWG